MKKILSILKVTFGYFCIPWGIGMIMVAIVNPDNQEMMYIPFGFGVFILYLGIIIIKKHNKKEKMIPDNNKAISFLHTYFNKHPAVAKMINKYSINGFGTKYFTYCSPNSDGYLLATKWLTFGYLPIIPIQQDRIKITKDDNKIYVPFYFMTAKFEYLLKNTIALNKNLVRYTYIFYFLVLLPLITTPVIIFVILLINKSFQFSTGVFWLIILGCLFWAILWFMIEEYWSKKYFMKK